MENGTTRKFQIPTDQEIVVPWQADGDDVRLEVDLLLHADEGEVVIVREEVVLGVHDLSRDLPLHVRVALRGRAEVPLPDSHPDFRNLEARKVAKLFLYSSFQTMTWL